MLTNTELKRKLLSPPGDTIQETIDTLGMSQIELAERMGKDKKNINQIIKGKEAISLNTANLLERILGIPANFWYEREKEYRQELALIEAEEVFSEQIQWLKEFPINAMQEFGWIAISKDKIQNVKSLLTFFGVAQPQQWKRIYIDRSLSVSFRMSLIHANSPGAMSAWLRKGELQTHEMKINDYDADVFHTILDEVKLLVINQPADFKDQLQKLCAKAGVALVFTPCLPKVTVSGAARWIKNISTPLIQLSGRYKTNDHFWFSFYHEAGHILKHRKKDVFLEDVKGVKIDKKKEEEANAFATERLFPGKAFKKLCSEAFISERLIYQYADLYKTHPAIIVGRLEHEGKVAHTHFHHLKVAVSI
jgi:HTH-type transcriptional regulator / antitoxin HigA